MTSPSRDVAEISSPVTPVASMPRALVVTARRWLTTTRLALELSEAGFSVDALCPSGHSLARVGFVRRAYRYNALRPLRSLQNAIEASQPDLLIPADEDTVAQLHRLYSVTEATTVAAEKLRVLIERSLGDPKQFAIIHARDRIALLAHALGVISPTSVSVCNEADLERKLEIIGFPAVLKTNGSLGGWGVAIVHDLSDARRAFRKLSVPPGVVRTLKRLVINGDANLVIPCLLQRSPSMSIQAFVCGRLANAAVACWKGEVLAHVAVEVLATRYTNGPATIVRLIEHPGISEAVTLMAHQLNLSGLCGFDFILDPINDGAHMIEFNPRATQTCHLVSADGKQLLVLLAAQLHGHGLVGTGKRALPIREPIALFPYGLGDPENPLPKNVYKDVPSQSPQLINLAHEHPFRERFLSRFRARSVHVVQGRRSRTLPRRLIMKLPGRRKHLAQARREDITGPQEREELGKTPSEGGVGPTNA